MYFTYTSQASHLTFYLLFITVEVDEESPTRNIALVITPTITTTTTIHWQFKPLFYSSDRNGVSFIVSRARVGCRYEQVSVTASEKVPSQ
jgi:hypothetical protein